MAFIDIKDPKRRDEIVRDYENTLKQIQERKIDQKTKGLEREEELRNVFKPVTQATKESTKQITSEIKKSSEIEETTTPQKIDYYLNDFTKSHLDKYFGIQLRDGKYKMGEKELKIVNNNILVDFQGNEHELKDSPGLWRLIMMNKPLGYDEKDLNDYKNLLYITDVLNHPLIHNTRDKPYSTSKYTFFKENNMIEEEEEEDDEEVKKGHGFVFLPGDIEGLLKQLRLLYAENRAGNTSSTRNHIIAILDQLQQRGYLSQQEYNAVCNTIQC